MNERLATHLETECRTGIARNATWLWIVNPRTGHTSVRRVLRRHCQMSWRKAGKPLWEIIKPKIPDDIFMFTFVRNPWDRVLSAYFALRTDQGRLGRVWRHKKGARLSGDFNEYVRRCLKKDYTFLHFKPQITSVMCDGEWIPNLFIGRFEQLEEDWQIVAEKLGVSKELPHYNKTHHKSYVEQYNERSRRIVADLYAEEIKALGYKFGD